MSDYYPSPQATGALHEDFRKLFEHMYETKRELAALRENHAKLVDRHQGLHDEVRTKPEPGGPSNTKITGLYVRGTPPAQGRTITNLSGVPVLAYNAATGEVEWTIPA